MTLEFTREIKAVLFDLDDTLFDHRHTARCVLEELQSQHHALSAHPLDMLEKEDFRLLTEKHSAVLAGSLSLEESRLQRIHGLFAYCGAEITAGRAREIARWRVTAYRRHRRAVPGAVALLERLKRQVKIGIVTNNFTEEQQGKMEVCGMTPLVDVLITSEDSSYVKPDREIFYAALASLGCEPAEAVMVGDSWDVDIIGALNAGLRAVWFNRSMASKPGSLDVIEIHSLEPADLIAARIISPAASGPDPRSLP